MMSRPLSDSDTMRAGPSCDFKLSPRLLPTQRASGCNQAATRLFVALVKFASDQSFVLVIERGAASAATVFSRVAIPGA